MPSPSSPADPGPDRASPPRRRRASAQTCAVEDDRARGPRAAAPGQSSTSSRTTRSGATGCARSPKVGDVGRPARARRLEHRARRRPRRRTRDPRRRAPASASPSTSWPTAPASVRTSSSRSRSTTSCRAVATSTPVATCAPWPGCSASTWRRCSRPTTTATPTHTSTRVGCSRPSWPPGRHGCIRGTRGGPNWSILVAVVMALVLAWSIARLVMDAPPELRGPRPCSTGRLAPAVLVRRSRRPGAGRADRHHWRCPRRRARRSGDDRLQGQSGHRRRQGARGLPRRCACRPPTGPSPCRVDGQDAPADRRVRCRPGRARTSPADPVPQATRWPRLLARRGHRRTRDGRSPAARVAADCAQRSPRTAICRHREAAGREGGGGSRGSTSVDCEVPPPAWAGHRRACGDPHARREGVRRALNGILGPDEHHFCRTAQAPTSTR